MTVRPAVEPTRAAVALWALASLVVTLGGACRTAHMDGEERQMKALRATLTAYERAVNDGDLNAILGFYADEPGFHWVESGRIAYESYAALHQAFEQLQDRLVSIHLVLGDPRIEPVGPGGAVVTVAFAQTVTLTSGQRVSGTGVLTVVAVRREDRWRFLAGHLSLAPNPGAR